MVLLVYCMYVVFRYLSSEGGGRAREGFCMYRCRTRAFSVTHSKLKQSKLSS